MCFEKMDMERAEELFMERMARQQAERDWRRDRHYDLRQCPVCEGSGVIEFEPDEPMEDDD